MDHVAGSLVHKKDFKYTSITHIYFTSIEYIGFMITLDTQF